MELRVLLKVLFSFFIFIAAACSSPSDQKDSSNQQESPYTWEREEGEQGESVECHSGGVSPSVGIVGGENVQKDSWVASGVVFIIQEYEDFGSKRTSICTGSLIDTNMVLTAAHCVDQSQFNYRKNLKVYFTSQPECESINNTLERRKRLVSGVRIHPLWNPLSSSTTNRGDIALLRLAQKAPAPYVPLKLAAQFIPIPDGFPVIITGFGMVNPDYYGDFGGPISLRIGEAPPITPAERAQLAELVGPGANGTSPTAEFENLPGNEMIYIDQTQGQGICGGDSGGPSILKNQNGDFVVTGVASFVMNPMNHNALCAYVAAHTSVVFHRGWIESAFRDLKNGDSTLETPFQ